MVTPHDPSIGVHTIVPNEPVGNECSGPGLREFNLVSAIRAIAGKSPNRCEVAYACVVVSVPDHRFAELIAGALVALR